MPGKNYSGGGSFYRQNGKMTRNIGQTNGNVEDNSPRKREERAVREAYRKERKLESYLADDENFPSFKFQLARMGLQLRDIPADGNCLFRALGDQLEGHCRNHFRHRAEVVTFMRANRVDFEPFVEDDMSFDDHVKNLHKLGTHAGNDAIVAFAKFHKVNVIIHQLNGKPLMIQGPTTTNENTRQLHIAYHNGDHYSSVRTLDDNTESPAHIRLQDPVRSESVRHKTAQENGGGVVSVKRGLEDIETEVALATNCTDMDRVRQVLCEFGYDVDASIADLLQQMELSNEAPDDTTSQASQQTTTTDSGVYNSSAGNSNNSSPNSNSGRTAGSVLKPNGNGSVNGKGHKVHFREDSFGGSSGYGSMSSYKGGGARPKIVPAQQMSQKKVKESKKMEKKRRAEERRREQFLVGNQHIPRATDVRDVTVVAMHDGGMQRI